MVRIIREGRISEGQTIWATLYLILYIKIAVKKRTRFFEYLSINILFLIPISLI